MISLQDLNNLESFQRLDTAKRFIDLIVRFAEQLDKEGVSVIPYTDKSLAKLATLEAPKVARLYDAFSTYYEVLHSTHTEGSPIINSKRTLWKIFKRLGYRPCSDLMESIHEGDVIEIYASDWVQTYRNMEFLNLCSYDLASLFTHEFHELFERPDFVNKYIFDLLYGVFSGKIQETTKIGFEPHILKEMHSAEGLSFYIEPGIISPLKSEGGNVVAFVNTLRVRQIQN
jgi:hypothetical protein